MSFQSIEEVKEKIEKETRLEIEGKEEVKTDDEGFLHFSFEVTGIVMDSDDLYSSLVQYVNLHGKPTAEGVLTPEENEV